MHKIEQKKLLLLWHIIGMVFISVLGSLSHFLFKWSGNWPPIGALAAVNESVWEHLKLAFWPLVIFSLIEFNFIKKIANNYFIAKAVACYVMPLFIICIFYTYTSFASEPILIIDIGSFFVAIIAGQIVSYIIIIQPQLPRALSIIAIITIIILGAAFILFTYFPPRLPFFQDFEHGFYGIR